MALGDREHESGRDEGELAGADLEVGGGGEVDGGGAGGLIGRDRGAVGGPHTDRYGIIR